MTQDVTIAKAFHQIIDGATKCNDGSCYLVLWKHEQFYGGPEEGGWYGWDDIVISYKRFASREAADAALLAVMELVGALTRVAESDRIAGLASEYDWQIACDPSADLDGPDDDRAGTYTKFSVTITNEHPEDRYGSRHYE